MSKLNTQNHSDSTTNRSDISPTQRVMLAVLNDALARFERGVCSAKATERQEFNEVDNWVASDETDWPFTFENVCACLNLDPDYLRNGLRRMKRDAFTSAQLKAQAGSETASTSTTKARGNADKRRSMPRRSHPTSR